MSYQEFLSQKSLVVTPAGFEAKDISSALYPFQADLVRWALRLGRAALFCDCGMGKTAMQLEWARQVVDETGERVIILAPLAVAQQTIREAAKFGIEARYLREDDGAPGVIVANYEMLHKFNPDAFGGVVLDESSILKAYDGKTRTQIIEAFRARPFRLACTATPAPNDFMELGNHSEFLGVMSRTEMLSMFFVHDGGDTSVWRLKGHAEQDFWKWVCSWAAMIRKPSDLGYDDGAFQLPPLEIIPHVVDVDHKTAWKAGTLFQLEALTLEERRNARRASVGERAAKAAELINESKDQWIVWCNLNTESDTAAKLIDGAVNIQGSDSREDKEQAVVDFLEGRIRVLVSKVSIFGYGLNFQNCANVAFLGLSDSFEDYYQSVRRVWRFGQTRAVKCHVITSEIEGAIVANIQRKEADSLRMAEEMAVHTREFVRANITKTERQSTEYAPSIGMNVPAWLKESANVVD